MINKAKEHGFDLNSLRARQFNSDDFEKFDLIITMDKDNYKNVLNKSQNPEYLKKVKLFLSNEMNVPDPYFGNEDSFEEVFKII